MQENTTAARPYAIAAFEQALHENKLSAWSEMLNLLNMVISDQQMQSVLKNPMLDADFLSDFVLDICGDQLSETGKNFVKVLTDTGRLSLIPQILTLFEQKRADAEGVVDIEVISAYPLTTDQQDKIADAMGKRFGKKIQITTRLDESLIGGAVIRAGDAVIDASVRGRLKQLGSELTG